MELAATLGGAMRAVNDRLILVVTGAGVSRASGIATFRGTDPGAVWASSDVELATRACFEREPVRQWSWYLQRFAAVDGAAPNPAHHALARLERWHASRGGRWALVTQNIDTLHEDAGSRELIKVHGSADRLRCSAERCRNAAPGGSLPRDDVDLEPFRAAPGGDTLPRCPACGAPLRAHVLFFDEYYHDHTDFRFAEVEAAAAEAALVIFAGTSFSVGVTDLILREAAARGAAIYSIDPAGRAPSAGPAVELAAPAEELLPAVASLLGA